MSESPCCGSCPCNDCTCSDNPNCPNFEKRSLFWVYQPQYQFEDPFLGKTYWACPAGEYWCCFTEADFFPDSDEAYECEKQNLPFRIVRKLSSEEEVYSQ